ncbi:DUF4386 family protein [Blastococcus saxobsidens]|uniref:Uncharacterized protein DUF4386 n=1 Tax=Blastococcus saxobsidens TaxID=138336 RepID=A0A4Q7Y8J2_9ACTN|nr:DUF4386 family protein [Blastococcus saxobsidens]RZU32451.1 uncharacterized protein DUF4386 [Blastococcus saxobsidens]
MTAEPLTPAPPATGPGRLPVPRPAPIGRRTAVVCLVVGSALNLAEALIGRVVGQNGSVAGSLEAWEQQPTLASIGLAVGTIAVPFLLLAIVAMAQLVRPHMPRLGAVAAFLGYVGGLGFLGIHAVSIIDRAAVDQPDRQAMVSLIESAQSSPLAILILAPFMLGLMGAVLLVSIGFLRTRAVPVWIPVLLLVFLVLDFGPFSTGPVDPHWLFVAASFGLAGSVAQRSDRQWWTGAPDRDVTP